MKEKQSRKGLYFLTISLRYIHFVKDVLGETIRQGNPWGVLGDMPLSEEEYDEKTKWSDFNINAPVFFNFYHGLELLLKGFLLLKKDFNLELQHLFSKNLEDFISIYGEKKELIFLLNKYLKIEEMPSILADCLKSNNIGIDDLYEFFRYPYNKTLNKEYDYSKLEHTEQKGIPFLKELKNDLDKLEKEAVKLYREIKNNNSFDERKN